MIRGLFVILNFIIGCVFIAFGYLVIKKFSRQNVTHDVVLGFYTENKLDDEELLVILLLIGFIHLFGAFIVIYGSHTWLMLYITAYLLRFLMLGIHAAFRKYIGIHFYFLYHCLENNVIRFFREKENMAGMSWIKQYFNLEESD